MGPTWVLQQGHAYVEMRAIMDPTLYTMWSV